MASKSPLEHSLVDDKKPPSSAHRLLSFLHESRAPLALLLVHSVFAGWNILGRAVLSKRGDVSPVTFSLIREVISSVLLIGMARWFAPPGSSHFPSAGDRRKVILLGTTGTFLNQIGFIYGLKYTNAMTAAVFQPLLPVATTLIAAWLQPQSTKISRGKAIGLGCSVAGAVIVVLAAGFVHHAQEPDSEEHSHHATGWEYLFGTFMLSINIVAFGYSLILQKKLLDSYTPRWITAWSYSIGCLEMFVCALIIDGPKHMAGGFAVDWPIAGVLFYVIAFATVMNYSLLSWANKQTNSETVAVFFSVNPFVTSVLAFVVLGEELTLGHVLGGSLIMWGLLKFRSESLQTNAKYEKVSQNGHSPDVESHMEQE